VEALASVFTFMNIARDTYPSLAAALSIGPSQSLNLSPAAAKLRERFKDLVGFERGIIHELGHAVVATYLDQALETVTIEPDRDLAAACVYLLPEQFDSKFAARWRFQPALAALRSSKPSMAMP